MGRCWSRCFVAGGQRNVKSYNNSNEWKLYSLLSNQRRSNSNTYAYVDRNSYIDSDADEDADPYSYSNYDVDLYSNANSHFYSDSNSYFVSHDILFCGLTRIWKCIWKSFPYFLWSWNISIWTSSGSIS